MKYTEPDPDYVVKLSIREVVAELSEMQKGDLVEFLNRVAERYEKYRMVQNSVVLRRTAEELGMW